MNRTLASFGGAVIVLVGALGLLASGLIVVANFCSLISWRTTLPGGLNLEFLILVDSVSVAFWSSVRLVAGAVFLFSRGYIDNEKYFVRFHLLVIRFVFSIGLLIGRPNLIRLLLG